MNTNCDNKFYDVTINDLIPLTLRHWRKILLVGIVIAVALGLYKFIPLNNTANEFINDATKLSEYEADKKLLQESVEKIQSEVKIKEKELEESIYLNLDPALVTRGFISFYLDTPIKDDALGYQQNLVNSYVSYFESGEIYDDIANQLDEYIKPVYLAQMIKTKTDYANGISSFNIYVMGSNNAQTDEIMQLIKQAVYNKKTDFCNIVTEHSISLVSENITVVADTKVKKDQEFQTEGYEALTSKLNEKKSELQSIESEYITKEYALLSGAIFGFVGLLCGMLLAIIYFTAVVIFSNKIKTRKQIIGNYSVDVLGEYIQENKKNNKIDIFISKLAKEPYDLSIDEINQVIANNILAISKSNKILILGCKDITNTEEVFESVSSCEILKNYAIKYNDKSLNNPDTLSDILSCDAVITIVKKNKTTLDELQNAIYTFDKYNKEFIGIILA
jgi:hypothetical protein